MLLTGRVCVQLYFLIIAVNFESLNRVVGSSPPFLPSALFPIPSSPPHTHIKGSPPFFWLRRWYCAKNPAIWSRFIIWKKGEEKGLVGWEEGPPPLSRPHTREGEFHGKQGILKFVFNRKLNIFDKKGSYSWKVLFVRNFAERVWCQFHEIFGRASLRSIQEPLSKGLGFLEGGRGGKRCSKKPFQKWEARGVIPVVALANTHPDAPICASLDVIFGETKSRNIRSPSPYQFFSLEYQASIPYMAQSFYSIYIYYIHVL